MTHQKLNRHRGSMLITVIAGFAIFGIMLAGAAEIIVAKHAVLERSQKQSNEMSSAAAAQVLGADGIDPTQVRPLSGADSFPGAGEYYDAVEDTLREHTNRASVANFNWDLGLDNTERANAMGLVIFPEGAWSDARATQLNAPIINYFGTLQAAWFPLGDLVTFPSNPSGTTYHYTTDGTTPQRTSPTWTGSEVLGVNTMYANFNIRAFHADLTLWSPSDTASAAYALPEVNVVFARESGGTSTDFTYYEIDGNNNRIELSNSFMDGFGRIVYGIDSDPNSGGPQEYTAPFHVPLSDWDTSVSLNAAVYSTNPNFPITIADGRLAASIDRWTLEPFPFQLPMPNIDYTSGDSVDPGATVDVQFTGDHHEHGNSHGEIGSSVTSSSPIVSGFTIDY